MNNDFFENMLIKKTQDENILKTYKLKDINTSVVNDLLLNKNTGIYMKAVLYLFSFLLKNIDVFIDIDNIESSLNSEIYISKILSNIKVIIKVSIKQIDIGDILREYFIGLQINKLRYIIPNYVYTLGSNLNLNLKESENKFICFEHVEGRTLRQLLTDNKLTFNEFVDIFGQILLALEIGQRNMNFCHYDLHANNIICKEIKQYTYKIPINDKLYTVKTKKYLPVIIDFGLSSVKYKNKTIGSYDFPHYGMYNYLLSGVDMYKLLVSCFIEADIDLRMNIVKLFEFYGNDDPYKLNTEKSQTRNFVKQITDEFVKKGSSSKVASYIPLDFFNWIYDNKYVTNVIKKDRNLYMSLYYTTTIKEYDNIFGEKGKKDSVTLIDNCTNIIVSYIILKYNIKLLKGYNLKLNSIKLEIKINKLKFAEKNKLKLIQMDKNNFNFFLNLKIPNIEKLLKISKKILNIKILHKRKNISTLIESYISEIHFFTDILPYLQIIYTIKELKLEKEYKDVLDSFFSSTQYKVYNKYNIIISRTYRWCKSLLEKSNN